MIVTRAALRKCAYHFLRNAAASFLATHRSTTQISHNAIRNPTTGRSNPMSFQKDLAPPGIHDGTCAIAKSTSYMWVVDRIGAGYSITFCHCCVQRESGRIQKTVWDSKNMDARRSQLVLPHLHR